MSCIKIFSDKINHVDFFVNQNNVFFKEGNSIIKIDESLNRIIFFTKDNPFIIESITDEVICIRDKVSLSYVELSSGQLSKIVPLHFQNAIQVKYQDENFIVLRNQVDENDWRIFCIDTLGEVVWDAKDEGLFFCKGNEKRNLVCLFLEAKEIVMKQINNGSLVWEINVNKLLNSEPVYLNTELIDANSKLYFIANGVDLGGLFCLDINSGNILREYPKVSSFLVKDENFIYSSLYENIVCKINPITDEIEKWEVNDLIKENGFDNLHDNRCKAHKGLVYFTQTLGDNKSKLGVLDTNKKELVYKYEFEAKNGGIGNIQVSESRIFITTQDNTLHIFKNDEEKI